MILVVVRAEEPDRASEGLRAALGLGLRDEPVEVLLVGPAARFAAGGVDPRIDRALGTLERLGRPARAASEEEVAAAARRARAIETWTSSAAAGAPRQLVVGSGQTVEIHAGPPRFRLAGTGAPAVEPAQVIAWLLADPAAPG